MYRTLMRAIDAFRDQHGTLIRRADLKPGDVIRTTDQRTAVVLEAQDGSAWICWEPTRRDMIWVIDDRLLKLGRLKRISRVVRGGEKTWLARFYGPDRAETSRGFSDRTHGGTVAALDAALRAVQVDWPE